MEYLGHLSWCRGMLRGVKSIAQAAGDPCVVQVGERTRQKDGTWCWTGVT